VKQKYVRATMSFLLIALLSFSLPSLMINGFPAASAQTTDQTTPSCSSNSILHITATNGVPTNFNLLLPPNGGLYPAHLSFFGLYPDLSPLGVAENDSIATYTYNSNYTVWAFHVNPGETWSNGQPVTGQDIVNTYSSNFALNPGYDPVGAYQYVTKVYSNATDTAVFDLNQSNAHFPELIGVGTVDTGVYPQSFTSQGANYTGIGETIPSTGPFYISSYTAGSPTLIMYKNPYYKPQPQVCEIIFNFVEGTTSTSPLLIGGQTDLAPIDSASASTFSKYTDLKVIPTNSITGAFLAYNYTIYPFNETDFRQALVYAINQSSIVQTAFAGYGQTAYNAEGMLPPGSKLYNPNQPSYNYSTTTALSLLNSIGMKMGSNGALDFPNGTQIPQFTLWTSSSDTAGQIVQNIIQTDLAKIGLSVTTQVVSHSALQSYLRAGSHGLQGPSAMTIITNGAASFGDPYLASLPLYDAISTMEPPNNNAWLWPPNANADYWSNETAIANTANPQLETQYLNNVQLLQAQYLPVATLGYSDSLYGANTQAWTNWPNQGASVSNQFVINATMLASIVPASGSSTQTQTSLPTSTHTTNSNTQTSATSTQTSTTSSSTSSSSSSSNATLIYAAIAVVVIVIVIAIGLVFWRRGRSR
jgi:peptide/nickel transport system substrate-binding protein